MGWVQRKADEHVCPKPKGLHDSDTLRIQTGDIWECDECGNKWQVKVEFDQREPNSWFTWTSLGKVNPL